MAGKQGDTNRDAWSGRYRSPDWSEVKWGLIKKVRATDTRIWTPPEGVIASVTGAAGLNKVFSSPAVCEFCATCRLLHPRVFLRAGHRPRAWFDLRVPVLFSQILTHNSSGVTAIKKITFSKFRFPPRHFHLLSFSIHSRKIFKDLPKKK